MPPATGALDGRVALVTGAVRPPGMGRATAHRLATMGATVVCVDATPVSGSGGGDDSSAVAEGALDVLVADLVDAGASAAALARDIRGAPDARQVVDEVVDRWGCLDICCVMTGGTGVGLGTGSLLELSEASWDACLDANLRTPAAVAAAAAAAMVSGGGGSIVVLSSYAGSAATERYGAFGAARAGLGRLVEVMAQELGPAGVRVNAVLPLGVRPADGTANPGLSELAARTAGSADAWVRARIPLGRLQETAEVAALVAFLAGDDAAFVSGQSIVCAGGAPLRT